MRAALLLLACAVAGCIGSPDIAPADAAADAPAPHEILANLELPVVPDGVRLLADLEAFVDAAPQRFDNLYQHDVARDWLEAALVDAGLDVYRHNFTGQTQLPGQGSPEGQNIIGVLPAAEPAEPGLIIFGGHYDSAATAYGAAYDDGSGTLVAVELARAMAAYEWRHTLVFALWDQEEAGLIGSAAYVEELVDAGEEVLLFINYDMTGINWPAKFGGAVDVPVKVDFGGAGDTEFADLWALVVDHLGQPESSSQLATGAESGPSDHGAFLAGGYPAAWVRGAMIGNYPAYHNADTVETMIADVGGDRAALEAGFQTVLDRTLHFAFLIDQL